MTLKYYKRKWLKNWRKERLCSVRSWKMLAEFDLSETLSILKSVNLQYILRLVAWTMGQTNRRPRVWCSKYYFFILFIDLGHSKLFIFIFVILQGNKKINWKDFCKELCKKSWKKNNTWNIRCLVDDSFVPSSKQTSVLYCRLTDFWEDRESWVIPWCARLKTVCISDHQKQNELKNLENKYQL